MLIMNWFVSYAHVNLCHFFSSSWCQGLAATSACGSSSDFSVYLSTNIRQMWPSIFTFINVFFGGVWFIQKNNKKKTKNILFTTLVK